MPRIAVNPNEPLVFPVAVVIDTREGLPYSFGGMRTDACDGNRHLLVPVIAGTLQQGDYSLEGYTGQGGIQLERKSAQDLFGTLGQGRKRFQRELERLQDVPSVAAVVVEAEWSEILWRPPERSQLRPKTVYRSVIAWQQRYPRVAWWMVPGRAMGERTTFRILERFWREEVRRVGT
jgi:ERCC4-type nuclease